MELYNAIMRENANAVANLLKKETKLTLTDDEYSTPLFLAAENGNTEIVQILLDLGMDIEAKNCRGWTPLPCAVDGFCSQTVKLLLERGANIDAKTNKNKTPLELIKDDERDKTVQLLLKYKKML